MSRTFPARFAGRCAADCGTRIAAGDEVAYVGEDLVHADCAAETIAALDRLKRPARTEQPCPRCFLVHAGDCF